MEAFRLFFREFMQVLRAVGPVVRERKWVWIASSAIGAAVTALLIPGDVARSQAWFVPQDPDLVLLCGKLGYWGELHRAPLIVAGVVYLAGVVRRSAFLRMAALAAILAGAGAGIIAAAVKGATGRPRPMLTLDTGRGGELLEERFTGPTGNSKMQGFPSGHATHSTAVAAALAVSVPAVGVPALAGAGVISWSRMYFHRHYLGDVVAGTVLGGVLGIWFGLAARRSRSCISESLAKTTE
jgi:membrane-associated phospholipid phosphatase